MDDLHESKDSRHEPSEHFVRRLEDVIRTEIRRPSVANRTGRVSRPVFALAAAAVILISMAIGGGAVSLAYESQRTDLRDRLVASYEQRVELAKKRAALAAAQLKAVEGRVAVGVESQDSAQDARQAAIEADAQVRLLELQLEEVRLTSREPLDTASAPLVSGRDFVSERWRVELSVPQAALDLARRRVEAAQTRFNVGLLRAEDVTEAGLRAIEVEAAIGALDRKLGIRRSFLDGQVSAATAELRVLEADADQRRGVLARRIEFQIRQIKDLEVRAEIGTLSPTDLAAERLRLQELQLAMTKAEYDLALIREQIKKIK